MKKQLKAASPYMTIQEVADYFRASYTSVYRSRGVFARLRKVNINGRVLVLRADVEKLDRDLQAAAKAPQD